MEPCLCQPGTEENGWHEVRCERCRQAEFEEFQRAIRMADKIIAERRGLRESDNV